VNRLKLVMVLVGLVVAVVAVVLLWLAFKEWGAKAPVAILATILGGAGAVTGMTKITRDKGRAIRPDMGGRGTVEVTVTKPDGTKVKKTRKTRPNRPGSGNF